MEVPKMAKVTLTAEVLRQAIAAYTNGKDMGFSEGEQGPENAQSKVFAIMPGDIIVYQKDGKLICPDQATYAALSEILMDMAQEPTKPRQSEDRPQKGMNVSARTKPVNGLAMPSSALTLEKVREYFCKNATDEECAFALEVCQIRGLNPFKLDCYFVKFDGKDAKLEIMVSKNFFLKRAEAHPDFEYLKAGIIVQKGEDVSEVERSFPYPGEVLLGGWCIVKRKSNAVPFKMAIDLKTFKKENKFWNQSPGAGYMIRKTSISLDLKEAFPNDLGNLYDVDEMGIDPEREVSGQ